MHTPPTPSPADLYLARRSTAASRATARSALNAAARCLGYDHYEQLSWELSFAEASMIRAGVNALEPGWAKTVWSAVRQVVVIARCLRLIDGDVVADVLAIPGPKGSGPGLGRTPDDSEVAAMLDVALADPGARGRRDAAVLAVLAGCGLRRSEAAALDCDDWCQSRRRLLVRSGKGRRAREVPAPGWAADLIDEWIVSATSGGLLRAVDRWGNIGDRLSGHAVGEAVVKLARASGVDSLSAHSLRRYAITSICRLGDVASAQRFAGHSGVTTTIRSCDARDVEDLQRVVDRCATPKNSALRVA